MSASLEVGKDDKERNKILLTTKVFCPESDYDVPATQKKRIWSAMPGGGLNRRLTSSLSDFKQQKTV